MNHLFKNLSLLIITIIGMLSFSIISQASVNSTPMSLDNTWASTTITNSDEPQYYSITLPAEGILTLNYKSYASTTYWGLYSEDFTTKIFDWKVTGGTETTAEIRSQQYALEAGTYYLKLYCDTGITDANVQVQGHFKKVTAQDVEPNDSFSEATILSGHQTINAYISDNDEYDYYKFTVPTSGTIELYLASEMSTVPVSIWSPNHTQIMSKYLNNYGEFSLNDAPVHTLRVSLAAGDYYVRIDNFGASSGAYAIKYNDIVATSIQLNVSSLEMQEGEAYTLAATFLPAGAVIPEYEWTSSNSDVVTIRSWGGENPYLQANAIGAATISLKTTDGSNLNASFDVMIMPGLVDLRKSDQTTTSITLSWDTQDGVDGYRIYKYSSSQKKYVEYKDTTKTKLKVSKLKPEKKYKFKIAAYININGEKIFGDISDSYGFWTAPKELKGSNISSIQTYNRTGYYNFITVKWKKVKGATGYQIYGKTPGGNWQHLDGTKKTSAKLYTTRGYTYSLRVRPYRKKHGITTYGKWGKVTKYSSR